MHPRRHDALIKGNQSVECCIILGGNNLGHILQSIALVAWVNSFWAISEGEIDTQPQS